MMSFTVKSDAILPAICPNHQCSGSRAGRLDGQRDVAEAKCDPLRVIISAVAPDGSQHDIETTWLIGTADHLPRGRESRYGSLHVTELRVLEKQEIMEHATFRLTAAPATQPQGK
jgi:hypothetical protein